jgi:hypothetical protein
MAWRHRYNCYLCPRGAQTNMVQTFTPETHFDPSDIDSDSDVFHTGQVRSQHHTIGPKQLGA